MHFALHFTCQLIERLVTLYFLNCTIVLIVIIMIDIFKLLRILRNNVKLLLLVRAGFWTNH